MMRTAVACALLLIVSFAAVAQFGPPPNYTGKWKLESTGSEVKSDSSLDLVHKGTALTGKLITPHGEFPLENGHAQGTEVFFNVTIERDEYKLKTTYRGQLFSAEVQFTVEAGERTLQLIARRDK
jgi:hypothetical protein